MLEIKLADVADYPCDKRAQDSVGGHHEVGSRMSCRDLARVPGRWLGTGQEWVQMAAALHYNLSVWR